MNSFKSQGQLKEFGIVLVNAIDFIMGQSTIEGHSSYEMEKMIKESSPRLQREHGQEIKSIRDKAQSLAFSGDSKSKGLETKESIKDLSKRSHHVLLAACEIIEGK